MEKLKRILAILAIISLIFCALLTLVFALLTNFGVGDFTNAWKCMVNDNIAGAFLCNDMDLQVVEETIEKTLAFKLKF